MDKTVPVYRRVEHQDRSGDERQLHRDQSLSGRGGVGGRAQVKAFQFTNRPMRGSDT